MTGEERFFLQFDVSRETREKLSLYHSRLTEWSKRINLVSRSTLEDIWQRHFTDSAQISHHVPDQTTRLVDFGSGAGFPGLVLAILREDIREPILIESDIRKCAFLRTVARETETNIRIINQRIEAIQPLKADVITARALANLSTLLSFAHPHLSKTGCCLFLKGNSWEDELTIAQQDWHMEATSTPSLTDSGSALLTIGALERAGSG